MDGKQAQVDLTPELAGELFGAVAGVASFAAPTLDLAPLDAGENPVDHAIRLLKAIGETGSAEFRRLQGEVDHLKRSAAALKAHGNRARATIVEMTEAAKPRKVGAMENGFTPAELLAAIGDAEEVAVVFSDGKSEIKGLAPLKVDGDAWREITAGLQLKAPELVVHGPAPGHPPYFLAGYGLLLDGEQVAWGARLDKRAVGAGQTLNITGDVVFQRPAPKPAA